MIRISLTEEEKSALNQLRLSKKSSIGERVHYVLLSHKGKSIPEIAQHLSRNDHTIRLWLQRYVRDGISGLRSRTKPGRPAKKAPVIESRLQKLLDKSPQEYGYQERGWQIKILRACDNTLVKSLDKLRFVYNRFSKTLPANAPSSAEKEVRIAEIIRAISEGAEADIERLFADESHFSNQPCVSQGWFNRGEKNGKYGQKKIKQKDLWSIKPAHKPILLGASKQRE